MVAIRTKPRNLSVLNLHANYMVHVIMVTT